MSAIRSWSIGLPAFVSVSSDEDGNTVVTVDVDVTEVTVAVRDAVADYGMPSPTEGDYEAMEKFIELVYAEGEPGISRTIRDAPE